jgi:hypothetical protein
MPEKQTRGPFLSVAVLCEKVLEEKDGVKSAIRIVDRVTRSAVGPKPPVDMQPFNYELTLFLKFKSGWARGSQSLTIEIAKPSGETTKAIQQTIFFEGEEDRGIDIVGNLKIKFELTGIYWFHIYLNDEHITQIPLRIIYMPQVIPQRQGPGPSESSEPDQDSLS